MLFFFFGFRFETITAINPPLQNALDKRGKNILRHILFGDKIIQNCLKIDTIDMIMIYYWDKKHLKRLHVPEADRIKI